MNNSEQKLDKLHRADISKGLLRLIGIMILLDALALAAGISFFMIIHGALLSVRWSAPYWKFTRNIFVKATGFPEEHILLGENQITLRQGINLLFKAVTVVLFFILGIWFLIRNGFCGQNLFC